MQNSNQVYRNQRAMISISTGCLLALIHWCHSLVRMRRDRLSLRRRLLPVRQIPLKCAAAVPAPQSLWAVPAGAGTCFHDYLVMTGKRVGCRFRISQWRWPYRLERRQLKIIVLDSCHIDTHFWGLQLDPMTRCVRDRWFLRMACRSHRVRTGVHLL